MTRFNLVPSPDRREYQHGRAGKKTVVIDKARLSGKVAVGIIAGENEEALALERWFSNDTDIRNSPEIGEEIQEFIERHDVKSVVLTDGIIGCPHEEGIDYEGTTCPECQFWSARDRWTGKIVH